MKHSAEPRQNRRRTISNKKNHLNMKKLRLILTTLSFFLLLPPLFSQPGLELNEKGYFAMPGLNVTIFSDIYPEGHQTGVTVIQHGRRVAANGDVRLEPSPGQWSPVPKGGPQTIDEEARRVTQRLWYPDTARNRTGFNPIEYPDLAFAYEVSVTALEDNAFKITVDLDQPLPEEWIGKVGFNFELFPGHLFGKSYIMDGEVGHFHPQPSGPVQEYYGEWLSRPMAEGTQLTVAPGEALQRMSIESNKEPLQLWDGRSNHNNSWFIVRSPIPAGATDAAVEWVIRPHVEEDWQYEPVIQVSQLGYHPDQPKRIIIEQDQRDETGDEVKLFRLTESGPQQVDAGNPEYWGQFLRYNYFTYDFSDIQTPGMYIAEYRSERTHPFQIEAGVYNRFAWQPTLEYYLPVQMCHMRINEKYRVWHGLCHLDDALMAPVDTNHFDGYVQGPSTLTEYESFQPVAQLNRGGWHDAGDYDLRVESQIGTIWMLALMIEEFGLNYDATFIDQEQRLVEIHQPDGHFKIWPFFWQQTEYVMGGGATNYMFLALAAQELYGQ